MSRGMRMSVLGLYNYNDDLFSNMLIPTGLTAEDQETIIANILSECAELEVLFPDWYTLHAMIGFWSRLELPTWQRIYNASIKEYNPIENYNRTELETIGDSKTETHSGNDTNRQTGTDITTGQTTGSTTNSGTDSTTNSTTAYDANTLYVHDKSDLLHGHAVSDSSNSNGSIAYGRVDTLTHGEQIVHDGEITRENHTSGNIGVTTSQQMLEQEIEVSAKLNILKIITESFKDRFCLLVY